MVLSMTLHLHVDHVQANMLRANPGLSGNFQPYESEILYSEIASARNDVVPMNEGVAHWQLYTGVINTAFTKRLQQLSILPPGTNHAVTRLLHSHTLSHTVASSLWHHAVGHPVTPHWPERNTLRTSGYAESSPVLL